MTEKVSRRNKKARPKTRAARAHGAAGDPSTDSHPIPRESIATGTSAPVAIPNTISTYLPEQPMPDTTSLSTQSCFTYTESDSASALTPVSSSAPASFSPLNGGHGAAGSKRGRRAELQLQLAKLEQLYGYELFEECFVAQFVGLVTSARDSVAHKRSRTWFLSVPEFLSRPATPSVKYCIRAAALAYYSIMYHNKSAEMTAVEWYLAGLESHRSALARLRTTRAIEGAGADGGRRSDERGLQRKIPDSQDICVPLLFSYFECMKGSGTAWTQHMSAAVEMLLVRGPARCQTGHEHAMFRSVRPYDAFRAILSGEPSNLDTDEWCDVPFTEIAKIALDYIVDILLALPRRLALPRGRPLRDAVVHGVPAMDSAAQNALEARVYSLLHELQNWRWYFDENHRTVGDGAMDHSGLVAASTVATCERPPLPLSAATAYDYQDTLTALTIAVYDSVNIVLYSVLLALAAARQTPAPSTSASSSAIAIARYQSCVFTHSSSILNAAAFQNFADPYCGDTTRTSFPVQVVVLLSLDDAQRLEAQKYINLWGYNHEVGPAAAAAADPRFRKLEAQ